jgi:hypothetical protein
MPDGINFSPFPKSAPLRKFSNSDASSRQIMASKSTSKLFPGFESVYRLGSTGSERPFHAQVDMTEEQSFTLTRAEITLPYPVQARWAMGRKKPSDFIWTTLSVPRLVSERVVTILRDAGLTGWRTYDLELVGHDGAPIPGYYGFAVHGRCGPIDNSKSVEMPTVYPGGIFPAWHGLYFEPDTWDGSDFFMSKDGFGAMFVVEDVRRVFRKAKIRNVDFKRLVDITRSRLQMELLEKWQAEHPVDAT